MKMYGSFADIHMDSRVDIHPQGSFTEIKGVLRFFFCRQIGSICGNI